MRGPNKLPSGAYPKAVSEALYSYHISADISYEQRKNVNEYAKIHNCSKAEVVRKALDLYFKPVDVEEPKKNRFKDKFAGLTKFLSKRRK